MRESIDFQINISGEHLRIFNQGIIFFYTKCIRERYKNKHFDGAFNTF